MVAYLLKLPRIVLIGGAVVVIAIGAITIHFLTRSSTAPEAPTGISHVQIASVASLSSASGPLPVTGTVTSLSQASILAQSSGEIVSLSRSIGDHVVAGQIIGQFENSAQQAALLQAQGAYEGAQAALAKVSGTTAQNSNITSTQATQNAQNASDAAMATLQSTYSALDDAVHAKADPLFSNPRATSPMLLPFTIPNSQIVVDVENERTGLDQLLLSAQTLSDAATSPDVDADIATMTADAQTIRAFLNDLNQAISQAQPSQNISAATIAADQAAVAAARTEVVSALSGLAGAKTAYDAAASSAVTAANSAGSASGNDVASAQASVKSALGALDAAQSNLEKTVIRSPISGTIVSLSVTQGDFVPAFSQVAQVSNPGALYIDTHVTSDDAKTLAVGGSATIEGGAAGTITFVAPAIDPTTGKVEVKVGITSGESALTDGEVVTVSLGRTQQTSTSASASSQIVIPIVAAKITPTGPVVFIIGTSTPSNGATGVLDSHPITLGSILGDRVVVLSGLTGEMDIVTDARGLADGESVIVDPD